MASNDDLHKLNDFLSESGIEPGGCAVYQANDGRYYMATLVVTSSGPLFLINDRFFYDYAARYRDTQPWKLLYTKPN